MPKLGRTFWICLLLAGITLSLYFPVTHFEFVNYDDGDYVSRNDVVQKGLTVSGMIWALRVAHASNWHPVTWVSHMMDCELYGLNAGGHHFTNVLFHATNAVLLFLLLRRMTGATWRSALVAALFAWHPLHVESVAWVSERKDVLSAFFFFLTIWAYVGYAESKVSGLKSKVEAQQPDVQVSSFKFQGRHRGVRTLCCSDSSFVWYFLALFLFALGLMSKPMLVTLPFVLLLLDFWPLGRFQPATCNLQLSTLFRFFVEKLPFFALAAFECMMTVRAQRTGMILSLDVVPLSGRIANALVTYVLYLWKMIWPRNLAVIYPYSHEWTFWPAAGAGLFLLAISAAALWQARQRPYLAVGWFWFLGTLVPVIGLMQVGIASMADRYTYIPLIGIFIMAVWGLADSSLPTTKWGEGQGEGRVISFWGLASAAVLISLIICTWLQLQHWQNSVTLFSHTIAVTGDNLRAEYNLGQALADRGRQEEAIAHYTRALTIKPNRLESAGHSQMSAHLNLGLIFLERDRWAEAEAHFRTVIREAPTLWQAHSSLGMALVKQGKSAEAVKSYREGMRLNPDSALPINELAWFLATDPHAELRDGAEAVLLAQRACELTNGSEPRCLGTLDAAYAEAGRFEDAIATAQQCQALALSQGQNGLADLAAERLELYRAGKCYRQH